MKRSIIVLGAAALVVLAACQKEEVAKSNVALTATLEQQTDNGATKTALGESNTVVWSEGDKIEVHGSTGVEELTLTSGAGTTTGSFGTPTVESPDYAIYPSSAYTGISGSTITFTLPATQTYAAGSFGNGANVAVAKIEGSNMTFKNVCGALKLQLKGSMKVKTIELTGKNGEKLSGAFTVDAAASPFVGAVKSGEPTDAEKKVTLDCSAFGETSEGAADGGVQLDFETATVFNIIVPVSAFAGGFDAKITDVAGATFFTTLSTTSDNTIERSVIVKMPSKAVSLLPEDYEELEYLKSNGLEYFKTGIVTSEAIEMSAEVMPSTLGYAPNYSSICAARVNYLDSSFSQGLSSNVCYSGFGCNGERQMPIIPLLHDKIIWKQNKIAVWVNNVRYPWPETYSTTFTTPLELVAFGRNDNGEVGHLWLGNVYHLILKNNDTFVRYFISAKVEKEDGVTDIKGQPAPQGTLGMYDCVSCKFYTNEGTGTFIAGPELTD